MSNYGGRGRESSDIARIKTETVTFRLPVPLLNELKKDAKLEKMNLNAFVTRIFANHVEWERYERKMGLLPMTKPFLKAVINRLNDEEIVHLAEKIEKQNFKNIFTFMRENHDVSDFIEILRSWLTVSWMDHTIVNRNESYYLNIQHDLGIKWSLYVKTLVSELYQDILGKRVAIDITEGQISFIFSK
jgi:hypothetical protein